MGVGVKFGYGEIIILCARSIWRTSTVNKLKHMHIHTHPHPHTHTHTTHIGTQARTHTYNTHLPMCFRLTPSPLNHLALLIAITIASTQLTTSTAYTWLPTQCAQTNRALVPYVNTAGSAPPTFKPSSPPSPLPAQIASAFPLPAPWFCCVLTC